MDEVDWTPMAPGAVIDEGSEIRDLASPGEVLAEELATRNLTLKEFAKLSGISEPYLRGLCTAKKPWKLSCTTARKIGQATQTSGQLWISLEKNYRSEQLLKRKMAVLAEIFEQQMMGVQKSGHFLHGHGADEPCPYEGKS